MNSPVIIIKNKRLIKQELINALNNKTVVEIHAKVTGVDFNSIFAGIPEGIFYNKILIKNMFSEVWFDISKITYVQTF